MDSEFHLRATTSGDAHPRTRIKPPPQSASVSAPFSYSPSDDGADENLLILLHGLGDTHVPFSKLGRSFKLPQTATLALRAPEQYVTSNNTSSSHFDDLKKTLPPLSSLVRSAVGPTLQRIPYLYENAFQWYPSFDALGDLLARPNPTTAIDYIAKVLEHLVNDCGWPAPRIHLFGFAQGGTVAAESALDWWRRGLQQQQQQQQRRQQQQGQQQEQGRNFDSVSSSVQPLGSVVTIGGPLLSYPTLSAACPTPTLVFHRPSPTEPSLPGDALAAFRKGFSRVLDVKRSGEGMPRSKDEWYPVMELWSERLGRRQLDGLYEVMTGGSSI